MREGRGQARRQGGGGARGGDLYGGWSTAAFGRLWLGFLVGTGCNEPADVFCPVLVGVRKLAVGPVSHAEDRVVGKGGGRADGVGKRKGRGSGGSGGSSGGGIVGRVERGRGGGEEGLVNVVRVSEVELSRSDDKGAGVGMCVETDLEGFFGRSCTIAMRILDVAYVVRRRGCRIPLRWSSEDLLEERWLDHRRRGGRGGGGGRGQEDERCAR